MMLDLTRRQGQRVYVMRENSQVFIPEEKDQVIIIEVKEVDKVNGVVTLSFDAPPEIKIWREELILKKLKKGDFHDE